jgi:hypothetical protein
MTAAERCTSASPLASGSALPVSPNSLALGEAARLLARQLHAQGLVLAQVHESGLVDQDVGRLQQRVAEEAAVG